jgi:hypothetical protein
MPTFAEKRACAFQEAATKLPGNGEREHGSEEEHGDEEGDEAATVYGSSANSKTSNSSSQYVSRMFF